ncbi:shieldin complex subunit 2 isoform X2 [Platichthys flesus]|uniref:shieldin complex subunit 2 isoform X2 n=1 Tax=Platichthys flesus TaxID=8260 RepID=UPI002DBC699B|nr:shieldin complex subunit 2 isoform X2 [Platichthys flesus]
MCERSKIHVFLGAPPPPSSDPASVSEAGDEDGPPAGWRHLELTWTDRRLRPVAAGSSRDEADADRVPDDRTNADQDQDSTEADRTKETSGGRARTNCHSNTDQRKPCSDDHAATSVSRDDESDLEKEDGCSASVLEYLDVCFPAAQPDPPHRCTPQPVCTSTQYLSTWTLSQALILRGRRSTQSASSPAPQTPPQHAQMPASVSSSTPELFSPEPSSPGASAELCSQICSSPKVEEGGVVLQVTADGLLCSQDAVSPVTSPTVKKARLSEDTGTEAASSRTTAGHQGPTTPLVRCHRPGVRYSVLVAVVHPCHLKEVKVKAGPAAGSFVPLASIVVTDQSGIEMKVVLWRRAAFWALTVSPGDVLLITGLQVNEDRWRGETVLQSTFCSKLLNLGHASTSPPALQLVDARSLGALWGHLQEHRPLLLSLPRPPPQDLTCLPYTTLRSLRVNTLVHALLRVTRTHISSGESVGGLPLPETKVCVVQILQILWCVCVCVCVSEWRSEAESCWRSASQSKAVLSVEQPDGHQGTLLLWGAAVGWLPRFNRDRAVVWDFHILLVREGLTSDLPELHSTPWSSVRPLDPADRRAHHFLPARSNQAGSSCSVELDLETLLSQKYSGDVELRVQVSAFHFQEAPSSQNACGPVLDGSTPVDRVLEALSGDVTYAGCGRCSAELGTDANGIYSPCYPCLPHTAVRRFYRPGVLSVSGRGYGQACVQVPPVPLEKILRAPPDKLLRSSAPGSEVKHIQVAADRILTLVSLPKETFTITVRSHFLCDENSAPLRQDLTLLDLQFPGGRADRGSRRTEEP